MKRIALSLVAGLGRPCRTAAMAHTDVSLGINLGGGYAPPQPTYVETYVAPAPVYYRGEDRGRYSNNPRYSGNNRAPLSHYRQHNEWVRTHPGQGGQIMVPPR